jgi:uncharacterized protein YndB with AHSA1/START domain
MKKQMDTTSNRTITVDTLVHAPIEQVWELWTAAEHISQWNNFSDQWHSPKVENDLCPGGRFLFVMALKDGSSSFDFCGTYDEVKVNELISYTLDDGRKSTITFRDGPVVTIIETFEPEDTQPIGMQMEFCGAILASFKHYAETKHRIVNETAVLK